MTDPLVRLMRDMLDGRENDEEITVSVSLLWSLIHKAEEPRADTAALLEYVRSMTHDVPANGKCRYCGRAMTEQDPHGLYCPTSQARIALRADTAALDVEALARALARLDFRGWGEPFRGAPEEHTAMAAAAIAAAYAKEATRG